MEEQILGCLLYWGKVKEDEVGYSWHRLVYHCLDVAAVGKAYLESRPKLLRSIREALGCEREDLIQWFAFLLALYDAGKFAFSFQGLKPGGGTRTEPEDQIPYTVRHGTLGLLLFRHLFSERQLADCRLRFEANGKISNSDLDARFGLTAGHRGVPVEVPKQSMGFESKAKPCFEEKDRKNAEH